MSRITALRCPLRNQGLAAKIALCCEMISQPNTPLCKNFRSTVTPFRSCEMAAKSPKHEISNFRSHNPISQGVSQLRNTPLAHECHFAAQYPHFVAAKWFAKMTFGCEITFGLRKCSLAMKMAFGCEMVAKSPPSCEITSKILN